MGEAALVVIILASVAAVGGGLALGLAVVASRRRPPAAAVLAASLTDAEPLPRLLADGAGRVLYANRAARALWGDGPPAAALAARLPDDWREEGRAALDRLGSAAAAGLAEKAEVPLRAVAAAAPGDDEEDGGEGAGEDPGRDSVEWWSVTVRPAPVGGCVWAAEDVTARRAIEGILLGERDEMAEFLYFTPVGLYSADSDNRLRFVNQRLAEWLGHAPEDLVGRPLEEVLADEAVPEAEGAWRGDLTFRTRGGHTFSALVLQSTFDELGETRTRTVVVRDGLAAVAPAPSGDDRRFRWLFDGAPVGLCLVDLDGCITDCNPAFERMTALRRDALIDRPLQDLLTAEDRVDLDALMQRVALGAGDGVQREVRLAASPDTVAALTVAPMGAGAGIDGLVAHFIDTTAQRNLEAQFAQAQKMQAMGQLAGGVAHDFNNLLTAMIGFCDLLLQRHGAGDPSFADLMQIKQNANRAANLVRQLLAFSRKQPLKPRLLDVTDALTEMSHLLRRLLGEAVRLDMHLGRDVGSVRVDPGQFDQVVINLAVNARDAMAGGGRLTIRTRSETVAEPFHRGAEVVPAGVYAVIHVSDTGGGIPRENLGRIFEPFFSTKTGQVGAGTGLGLSTVYGIIRQTGGFVFVESRVERGTDFTIYLPRHDGEPAATPPPGQAERRTRPRDAAARAGRHGDAEIAPDADADAIADLTGGGVVLLVEDEDPVRVFAARALRNKGYTVVEARTGEGALDVLDDLSRIDLLVTDMVMPGMDGATLARRVRHLRPDTPVILVSGYSEEAARGELTESVDFHFLPKPFSLNQLAAKVKAVLGDRAPAAEAGD
jgi:two-component system cell cycle sensor histidine kinase/response regulator CckA